MSPASQPSIFPMSTDEQAKAAGELASLQERLENLEAAKAKQADSFNADIKDCRKAITTLAAEVRARTPSVGQEVKAQADLPLAQNVLTGPRPVAAAIADGTQDDDPSDDRP